MKKLVVLLVVVMALSMIASVPTVQTMNLTFMQPCKPASGSPALAEWRISNPNSVPVSYTVEKAGTGQILSGVAPVGQSFFTTPWGAQTLILKTVGAGEKVKAGGDSFNGTICPTSCKLEKQNYGLAELWSVDGDYATMYIYPDANGNLPIGIGVERQQCVLGWVAARSGMFDFVYKNTCTGEYLFNGKPITPRADVLKKGVCARNGACR